MKLLLFEWLTCGGLWQDNAAPDPSCSMQRQGREMLTAVTEDFISAGLDIMLPLDERLSDLVSRRAGLEKRMLGSTDDLPTHLAELADRADYILLIAPESDECLLDCARWLDPFRNKLISPDAEFVSLTSCKSSTFEHLNSNGFDFFPTGRNYADFLNGDKTNQELPLPVVLKPIDGAGSEEVRLIEQWADCNLQLNKAADQYRIEAYISGTPVSVSMLCGYDSVQVLAPTIQIFDRQPFGHYVESGYPVDSEIAGRAIQLAIKASKALPPTRGYVGMDLVISDNADQSDSLIEVNPRLTMSYLKLREIYTENLALLMLDGATPTSSEATRTWTSRAPSL